MGYQFFAGEDFNFRVETGLGGVIHGTGDVGEILTAVGQITDGDDTTWSTAFSALAARVEKIAEQSAAAGQTRNARDAYLRAASYYASAHEAQQAYADDTTVRATFADHRRCWDAFARLNEPALEPVSIPYEGSNLPGYFLAVDASPRPTVVLINGSDGPLTWVWGEAQAAHDRGFNALMFDGPGQQSMLFERNVPFRPDWEKVITPVVDYLLGRSDVDPAKLVLWGGSQGGFWGARALAFEKRFAAAVLDPGVVDVATSWMAHLPPPLVQMLSSGDQKDFDAAMSQGLSTQGAKAVWNFRARPYGSQSPFEVYTAVQKYNVTDVAKNITTPLMLCDPEGEQFWPGQSAQLAAMVSGPVNLVKFTAAEGADMHCEPMARSLVHQRMYDWLAPLIDEKA